MKKFNTMTTGQIVACNFDHAAVFKRFGIDFCCNGNIPLEQACTYAKADMQTVLNALEKETPRACFTVDFQSWPTDLLLDYILKFHHRRIRSEGTLILELVNKVHTVHSPQHPELGLLKQSIHDSMSDLQNHLEKEEQLLFPYLYELNDALAKGSHPESFHCGSIKSPIAVMMAEHDAEGERWREISHITGGYTTPDDGCPSYRLMMERLKLFEEALHHHIHLENNILFPRVIHIEQSSQSR